MLDAFLDASARTGRFTHGAPRAVTISADGSRLLLLRSTGPTDPVERLWTVDTATGAERLLADPLELFGRPVTYDDLPRAERELRERVRLHAPGIGSYAATGDHAVVAFVLGGRLFRVADGRAEEVPVAGPAFDPRPHGGRIAYVAGDAVHVTGIGRVTPDDGAVWGRAEFNAAEELGRTRGHWWGPDGDSLLVTRVDDSALVRRYLGDPARPEVAPVAQAYPRAGGPNADVELHVVRLNGLSTPVGWDRETYPYLTGVDGLVITVYDRLQQHSLLLAVDPVTGATTELAAFADEHWLECVPGTPCVLDDGRILSTVEEDTRSLAVDGAVITPPDLYVRRLVGNHGGGLLVEACDGDPAEQHLFVVHLDGRLDRLTHGAGTHSAVSGGGVLVTTSATLDGVTRTVTGALSAEPGHPLTDLSGPLPHLGRPVFARVTEHGLPTAVVYPRGHVAGRQLPVLLDVYGGPGYQAITHNPRVWTTKQWWADQGFLVVTVDNRGTPNVSPDFTRAMFRRFSQVALDDQVAALGTLADRHPDLDLSRVGVRGWSFGGYLAALAVLRRPDVFHAASAGAPPTDFRDYDTAYTERYLGLPADNPDGYAADALIADAPGLRRPLLLIHGLADDNVHPLHSLRLSEALTAHGRPHAMVAVPGVSHMTPEGVGERLAAIELDFLRANL
ncbi:peptidase [Longispora fulva]|uniref:Dipeptidyl-peptidase-4 n=1 Tax=Longispora fulva TaxID=619741 RepID=A0A8J7GHW4_9ACTN|nr:prolyl oligopeptidase family serine peptidase [Longispora fulva]MBG6137815.1 dipeptidyl-peptidase-4 [Longispora fulva]GIG62027.1 peptidase [Longispora fulva]